MPSPDLLAGAPSAARRRIAWLVVIIMTGLFVLALGAVIWGFVRQARIVMAARAAPAVTSPPGGAAAVLTLNPGAHIVSVSTEAGKLVLQVSTQGGGEEVEIIDLATGKLAGQVKTVRAK